MKVIAAVFADFRETFLGAPARLRADVAGRRVLDHTLERLERVRGLDGAALVVRPDDARLADDFLAQRRDFELAPIDDLPRPRRELLRAARKWSLASWRGGALGTCWFDEFVEPALLARLAEHLSCDAVLCIEGHQAALDAEIAGDMVARIRQAADEAKLLFTQAPPGLAGVLLTRELIDDLAHTSNPLGLALAYRPESPRSDPITRPPCFRVSPRVRQTAARFVADTRRGFELLSKAFEALGAACGAEELCAWLADNPRVRFRCPVDVELELTTETALPDSSLAPPRARVPPRRLEDLAALERLARELAEYDDALVTLGGHGDPLLSERFPDACRILRAAGVCGVAVITDLVDLPEAAFEALFAQRVDVLEARLNADSPETYRAVHGRDAYEQVVANVRRIQAERRRRSSPQPILLCSLTRCTKTLEDLEPFYDRWIQELGGATLRGYNDYAGALPADTLIPMTPLVRQACRRLDGSLALLADGSTPNCAQDFAGETSSGSWREQGLMDIWNGRPRAALLAAHARPDLTQYPQCQRCGEWNRAH